MLVASSSLSSADYAGNSNTNAGRYGVKSVIYKVFGNLNSIQSSFFSPSHIQRQIMTKQIIHQQSAIQSLVYSLSLPSPHSPSHRGTHPISTYTQSQDQETRTWLCRAFQARHMQSLSEFVICLPQRKTRAYIIGGESEGTSAVRQAKLCRVGGRFLSQSFLLGLWCRISVYNIFTAHSTKTKSVHVQDVLSYGWVKKREEQRVRINQETKTKSNLFLSVSLFLGVPCCSRLLGPAWTLLV